MLKEIVPSVPGLGSVMAKYRKEIYNLFRFPKYPPIHPIYNTCIKSTLYTHTRFARSAFLCRKKNFMHIFALAPPISPLLDSTSHKTPNYPHRSLRTSSNDRSRSIALCPRLSQSRYLSKIAVSASNFSNVNLPLCRRTKCLGSFEGQHE